MGELRILDKNGDTKVIWDSNNADEVMAAKAQFEALRKKGFMAFKVDKDGDKDGQIAAFDKSAGKVIMVPPIVGG